MRVDLEGCRTKAGESQSSYSRSIPFNFGIHRKPMRRLLINVTYGCPGDFVAFLIRGDNDKCLCRPVGLEHSCDSDGINRRRFDVEVSQTQRLHAAIGTVFQIEEALCHDTPIAMGEPRQHNSGCGNKLHPGGND
jgi:hypothetical protein